MVIKTETCFFSDFKIFPGHGKRMVRKDGKLIHFANSKAARLSILQRKKALNIHWSEQWRKAHKKSTIEVVAKKRVRKTAKIQKAIAGVSLEEINKRRYQKKEEREAQRQAQLRVVKEKIKKARQERTNKEHKPAPTKEKAPKKESKKKSEKSAKK